MVLLLLAHLAVARAEMPTWLPDHPAWASSVGGAYVRHRGESDPVGGIGVHTEHTLLVPYFVQARVELVLFDNVAGPAILDAGYGGHASLGLHLPFVARERHVTGRTLMYGRPLGSRTSLHAIGLLAGVAASRGFEAHPDPTTEPRFALAGTHVFAAMWTQREPTEGPARRTSSFQWQAGLQAREKFVQAALSFGWLRVGARYRGGADGFSTVIDLGVQVQVARDVGYGAPTGPEAGAP